MAKRNYYINLKSEDFNFIRPETQPNNSTDDRGNATGNQEPNEIEEETRSSEATEEEYFRDSANRDIYDDSEMQSDRRIYRPLVQEIVEWLEAVEALSSRIVLDSGRLFGNLDPVPLIDELDPAPGSCFNCQQVGHVSRLCPKPRVEFCSNCGRRGESVVNCPRCGRHQRDFFARRRNVGRRRAASAGREAVTSARRSTSLARAFDERQGTWGIPRGSRASDGAAGGVLASSGALSRGEDESWAGCGRPRDSVSTEKPREAFVRGNKGPQIQKPRRRRSRRRCSASREWQGNPQGAYMGRYGTRGEEERRMPTEPIVYRLAENNAANRETRDSIYAMVEEWRQFLDEIELKTESRHTGETQQAEENHVARERQSLLPSSVADRLKCAHIFKEYLKRVNYYHYLRVEWRERSEEERIPLQADNDEYINLLEELNSHIGVDYCRFMISMKLSRSEVERLLALLKEVQHYGRDMKGMIILGELLFECHEPKWWRTLGNQDNGLP